MAEENKHKKIIEAKIGSNLEFAGEELEKIFEIATHTLKRNPSMLKAIAEEKQLIEQTTYKIAKKNELEEILQKLDTINSNQSTNTQPNKDSEIIEKSLLISQDFDKYYNDFVEYKIKSDKISKSSNSLFPKIALSPNIALTTLSLNLNGLAVEAIIVLLISPVEITYLS